MRLIFLTFLVCFIFNFGLSQRKEQSIKDVIQFSGKVVGPDEKGEAIPLPFTAISIKGTSRGVVADNEGFFSLVALKGETVVFSRLGFKDVEYTIPDTLSNNYYSWIQVMSEDDYWLDQVVIYPWPSKEHFKQEFLAIDISNELRQQAEANLASNVLKEIRYSVPADGKEAGNIVMRQTAEDYKYVGQFRPQRIFDIVAWKKFIEAWRRGDFKNKKKK